MYNVKCTIYIVHVITIYDEHSLVYIHREQVLHKRYNIHMHYYAPMYTMVSMAYNVRICILHTV